MAPLGDIIIHSTQNLAPVGCSWVIAAPRSFDIKLRIVKVPYLVVHDGLTSDSRPLEIDDKNEFTSTNGGFYITYNPDRNKEVAVAMWRTVPA